MILAPRFASIPEARAHLRLDTCDDDQWIEMMIVAVSAAILAWLKDEWRAYVPALDSSSDAILDDAGNPLPELDDAGEPVVLPVVKAAALVELAQQYRFRDGSGAAAVQSHWGHGYILGQGATALLVGLRKSTVA